MPRSGQPLILLKSCRIISANSSAVFFSFPGLTGAKPRFSGISVSIGYRSPSSFFVQNKIRTNWSCMISHLQKYLFHVRQPKRLVPRPAVLVESVHLTGCDLVLLE